LRGIGLERRIQYGPLMNTDERGFLDSLTERVLGAVLRSPTFWVPDLWKRIVLGFQIPEPIEAPAGAG
jgi:hypothetical protein